VECSLDWYLNFDDSVSLMACFIAAQNFSIKWAKLLFGKEIIRYHYTLFNLPKCHSFAQLFLQKRPSSTAQCKIIKILFENNLDDERCAMFWSRSLPVFFLKVVYTSLLKKQNFINKVFSVYKNYCYFALANFQVNQSS
jgi:hypothetical protein